MSNAVSGSEGSVSHVGQSSPTYPRSRRLVVKAAHGGSLSNAIDLTGCHNADAHIPLMAEIQEQCDMGYWHAIAETELPLFGGQ